MSEARVLSDAPWLRSGPAARVLALLNGDGEEARVVGGAVRNALLNIPLGDIDIATTALPDEVVRRAKAAGIKCVPTGIDHGTVTLVIDAQPFEVTTLREDTETFGRKARVVFGRDWVRDAERRDFTINGLSVDAGGIVHDHVGGLADIEARRVRFIGDAGQRIAEDYLRILRYFRFQARFGGTRDGEAEAACADLAAGLKSLSRERIGWELRNLLGLPDPAPTVTRMRELDVLQVVLPEAGRREVDKLAELIAAERTARMPPDAIRRMAALLPAVPPVAETVAARLRLSRSERQRLACAAARDMRDGENPRALAYAVGIGCAVDRLLLTGADPGPLTGWNPPSFPLKGGEIVARGIDAGPEVARILRTVEAAWVSEGFPDRARVTQMLDAELARRS